MDLRNIKYAKMMLEEIKIGDLEIKEKIKDEILRKIAIADLKYIAQKANQAIKGLN